MEVVNIIVTLGKDERCRLTSPTETAIMDVKCFICHGDFKEAVADVKTMTISGEQPLKRLTVNKPVKIKTKNRKLACEQIKKVKSQLLKL